MKALMVEDTLTEPIPVDDGSKVLYSVYPLKENIEPTEFVPVDGYSSVGISQEGIASKEYPPTNSFSKLVSSSSEEMENVVYSGHATQDNESIMMRRMKQILQTVPSVSSVETNNSGIVSLQNMHTEIQVPRKLLFEGNSENSTLNFTWKPTLQVIPRSGYDLPVYGLDNGQFYYIHIPAMTCIALSFVCAAAVIIVSFMNRGQKRKSFFRWNKGERLVVYLAICDGLFNFAHTLDHAHYVATQHHVTPPWLCAVYGFMLAEFISAQNLMVNVVAVNAFLLIYFKKNLDFGKKDWRLLLYTFGVPFTGGIFAGAFDQLGPNGAFCYFDGVRGHWANIFFTTIPLLLVFVINTVLYVLTWWQIYKEASQVKGSLGEAAAAVRASHRSAKNMMLFVAAFIIQWWAMASYGVWQFVQPPPQVIFQFVTTFSNIGGILNLGVFIIMRARKNRRREQGKKSEDSRSRSKNYLTKSGKATDTTSEV